MPRFTKLSAYKAIKAHHLEINNIQIRQLFEQNPQRFEQFSVSFDEILLDFSKNRLTNQTMKLLFQLARESEIETWRDKMFNGDAINFTEHRAVLHTALRNRSNRPIYVDNKNIMVQVNHVLDRMSLFATKVGDGSWLGYTGKAISDVVNIGIGGSDLGPQMACRALKPYQNPRINFHFISNVDGADIERKLRYLNPETTLFIVASKSFSTLETMTNANTARDWFLKNGTKEDIKKHFVAVSTNRQAIDRFGIDPQNMFEFWDWVGGRYSIWSAIGLSLMISIGVSHYMDFLQGAYMMDQHFRQTPLEQNLPVIMAMIGIWYNNFFHSDSHAILPYDHYLRTLTQYLQQTDMESNGKSVNRWGERVNYHTGSVIWGASGINGQHAFFQLLHQGTKLIPADFIVSLQTHSIYQEQHHMMVSSTLAQAETLMRGRNYQETITEMKEAGISAKEIKTLAHHRVFEGNHPSNTLLINKLNPKSLGMLIALYEHKIFVQGIIWNINSFDQWGVELGKQLTQEIMNEIHSADEAKLHDVSTNALINYYKNKTLPNH